MKSTISLTCSVNAALIGIQRPLWKLWNSLPTEIRLATFFTAFKLMAGI